MCGGYVGCCRCVVCITVVWGYVGCCRCVLLVCVVCATVVWGVCCRCVVSRDKLTCESAMYWQELCVHVHRAGTDCEQHLDMVLPACLRFCSYLQR